ncbi:MAG: tRNA pseudouridine(38-40) synthase TruA, partial [Lysobacteraceae bacterium]
AFLHHQVRSMVGTLMLAGAGRISADDVSEILASRDRSRCGPLAPARGLTLVGVDYGDHTTVR